METESLLYIKGLPTLLYHFLALPDRIADVLDYLITILKYRLGLCTTALQTLLSCITSSHGRLLQSWEVVKLTLPPQVMVCPLFLRLPLLIFF